MSSITRKWIRGANRVLEAPGTRLEVREGGERVDIPIRKGGFSYGDIRVVGGMQLWCYLTL